MLAANNYISGNAPSQADNAAFNELTAIRAQITPREHPHLFGWLGFVYKFNEKVRESWPAAAAKKGGKKVVKKEAKKEESDDMDLFGDDNEEDAAAAKEAAAAVKAS